jgi:aldose 1-epimerase
LTNSSGASAEIVNVGAVVRSLRVPDKEGHLSDVVLGCDTVEAYLEQSPYLGAIVGRYGNRIRQGRFVLDGHTYALAVNNGEHHLHGGPTGYHQRFWEISPVDVPGGEGIKATLRSPDGEEAYPGNVSLDVTVSLGDDNALRFDYVGTTDRPTILNPTHHGYFNLSGDPRMTILDHILQIDADAVTPVDKGLIPTGAYLPVEGTPMDFRTPISIGDRIDADFQQLSYGNGYDHNYVLNDYEKGKLRKVARVRHPKSGREMTVLTDQPGMQLYTGNFLDGTMGKDGVAYPRRSGFCLEAQHHPDSPNQPKFPSVVLRPGETYRQVTIYQFGTV